MAARANHDRTRKLQAWLARVAAAVLAVVMLVGVLRSGSSYFYCPSMKLVADAPCCDGDRHADHGDAPDADAIATSEVRSRDCCEQHFLAKLPKAGTTVGAPHTFAAALVATLPALPMRTSARVASLEPRTFAECRAGPMALERHRARLMVALN